MCQILLWVKNPKGPFGKQIQSAPEFQMTKIFRYQERLLRRGSVWAGIEGSGKVDMGVGQGTARRKDNPCTGREAERVHTPRHINECL